MQDCRGHARLHDKNGVLFLVVSRDAVYRDAGRHVMTAPANTRNRGSPVASRRDIYLDNFRVAKR